MQSGFKGLGEGVEHVALLLPETHHGGEDLLDEAAAVLALGAKARLAPDDGMAQVSLGEVVGGLDALGVEERPERVLELEDLLRAYVRSLLQQALHFAHERSHLLLEGGSRQQPHFSPGATTRT